MAECKYEDLLDGNEYDNAVYSEMRNDSKCYQAPASSGTAISRRDLAKNSRKTSGAVLVLFVLLMALLLGTVAACVAFALEIAKLKSETASLHTTTQQPQNGLLEKIQSIENMLAIGQQILNNSIIISSQRFDQNYTALDSRLQQLTAGLGTRGGHASFPVVSCAALPPSSPSGYYWVWNSIGSAVRVYCDPTRSCGGVTGGWRRVLELDMTNNSHHCPSGLRKRTDSSLRTCGTNPAIVCSSITIPTSALDYSTVCGMIRAYQVGSPDSFGDLVPGGGLRSNDINTNYVDGVSLTYGTPRLHIWTFAAALDEVGTHPSENCPCINTNQASSAVRPPSFVGNDYFCDTGARDQFTTTTFYSSNPLWDGAGCGPLNTCCSFNNPPWFYKQLPQPTTDNIEMRVCRDQGTGDEDIAIDMIQIYVQ